MVRTMLGTLPWAVVLMVAGGAAWWLLSREMAAGRWLLAALLVGHGVVHILFAVPAKATDAGADWPFNMARSWAITRAGLDLSLVRIAGVALITVVVVGFSLAALSTVGIIVPSGWWQAIVAGSAITSAILLVLFFQPQLVLGLGINAVLLGVVMTRAWMP